MPEEPAKLDETLDAKPYEPPKPRRRRMTFALWGAAVIVLTGAVIVILWRFPSPSRSARPPSPSIDQLMEFNRTPCDVTIIPTGWSDEVNGLRCKLEAKYERTNGLSVLVRVKNTGKEVVIVFKGSWRFHAEGGGAHGIAKPSGPVWPMAGPEVVAPGEDCAIVGDGLVCWPGKAMLWASYSTPEHAENQCLDEKGVPRGMSPEQLEKLENERKKSPNLPRVPVWRGQIETPRVSVEVERKKEAP